MEWNWLHHHQSGNQLVSNAKFNAFLSVVLGVLNLVARPLVKMTIKTKLIRELGEDLFHKLMLKFDDVTDLAKFLKQLKNAGVNNAMTKNWAEKFGKEGLERLLMR